MFNISKIIHKHKNNRLGLLTTSFIIIGIFLIIGIIFYSYNVVKSFQSVKTELNKFIVCEQTSETIRSNSNELTDLARLFIIKNDERFALAYLEEIENTRSTEKSLENLIKIYSDEDQTVKRLKIALNQAESITKMELYAIKLCYAALEKEIPLFSEKIKNIEIKESEKNLSGTELHNLAQKTLFDEGFLIYKTRINENCRLTVKAIADDIKKKLDESSEALGTNIDRLRLLIIALLIINLFWFLALKEFRKVTQSYDRIYSIGEKRTKILLKQAEYDALTGILNRNAYDEICKASAEQKLPVALILLDMDHFKQINDTYGHTGGDFALKKLAELLMSTFRTGDYVARIGGDEFAVILANFKQEGFKIVTEKIRTINKSLAEVEEIPTLSISAGISYSKTGYSEELYKQADKALYAVKEAGRKGCRIYDDSLNR
ncbi:GGDEF domain-containing protein [Treponema sp.]|uniref:GGDEF domain-containing protein n=1 Tax=Treponema sp. TaxID=166 RepID=UPI00388DCB21